MVYNAARDTYLDLVLVGLVFLGLLFGTLAVGFTWPVTCANTAAAVTAALPRCQHFGPYLPFWAGVAVCAAGAAYIAVRRWPQGTP